MRKVFLCDTDTGILYLDRQTSDSRIKTVCIIIPDDAQCHRTLIGKLHRIIQQIDEDLTHAGLVTQEHLRDIGIDLQMHDDILVTHTEFDDRHHIRQHFIKIIGILFDHHLTGIHFGEIQDLVDDGEQIFGRVLDHGNILVLFAAEVALFQEFRHTIDRIHRSTDLVAHICKEVGFGFQRFLRHFVLFLHILLIIVHAVTDEDQSHTGERIHCDIRYILA